MCWRSPSVERCFSARLRWLIRSFLRCLLARRSGCGASSAATPVPPNGLPAAIKPGATPSSPKTSDGGHLTSVQPDAPAGSAKSKAAAQETNTPDGATTQTGETTKDAKTTAGAAGSPSHKSTHPPNGTSLAGAPNSSSQQQQQQQISIASTTVTSKKDEPTQNQKGQDGTQKRDRDAARASHSSKLDMLQEHASGISRDTEAETQEILAKVLVCRNCEDVQLPLAVWCTSCHKDEDESPPVYCEACNTDLHQFAKTKQHVRESLSTIHTTRMKTATELGYPGTLLPPGLPQLESLACSNCDEDPQMYCTQCKTILCTSCAREIHQPKLLAAHTRHLLTSRFIAAGFHAAAKQHDKPVDKPAAISLHRTGSTGDSHSKPKQISVIQSPHALVRRTSAGANGSTASGGAGAKTFMPSSSPPTKARLGGKYRHRSTETTDIVPTENPGLPGDVYVFGDPSVNEPTLGEVQLTFRNISNPFDIIGTGVSIISVACGTDHAGAVTSLGSLFMWGNNHEKQLGCGSALGSERFTKDPILIEFPRHAPIKAVACGSVHTLALTQQGEVYAWGDGKMGKLGQVSDLDCDTPALVTLGHWGARGEEEPEDLSGEEEVVAIACGQNNSGCVVSGRKDRCQLYIWGEGQSGQIPSPDLSRGGSRPSLLPKLFPQLVCIQVSSYMHVASSCCSLLARSPRSPSLSLPLSPSLQVPEARSEPYPEIIALGFGTKHVVCITGAGAVFTWGETGFGACGYSVPTSDGDNVALQLTPRLVPKLFLDGVKAKAVACGERHTTILSSTGDVWSFGSGESHQIGISQSQMEYKQPVDQMNVVLIFLGFLRLLSFVVPLSPLPLSPLLQWTTSINSSPNARSVSVPPLPTRSNPSRSAPVFPPP
jgi:alpha-tubulin suppressor-like RCC1 family protein